MGRFGYTESDLARSVVDARFRDLLKFQVDRTYGLFRTGAPLVNEATSRLRLQLALTINGGMTILRKIERASFDVLSRRPTLSVADITIMLIASFLRKVV
jgi:phytoene/squalene synthetase